MKFGIICAMQEEIKELKAALKNNQTKMLGDKEYFAGQIDGQDVVLVESGIGKVEAAITAEHLAVDFAVDLLNTVLTLQTIPVCINQQIEISTFYFFCQSFSIVIV